MSRERTSQTGGLGLASVLTIVFVTLKLTDHIDWSWWWVLSPLWISFGLAIIVMSVALWVAVQKGF